MTFSHSSRRNLINLLSETASLGESCPSSGWLAKHNITGSAYNNGLCVTEHSCNLEAPRALDVHKETIRALHETLKLVHTGLSLRGRIQEIDGHFKLATKIDYKVCCGK